MTMDTKIPRRVGAILAACALGLAAPVALAQEYPQKPIKMITPYPPGGPTDVLARAISQKLSERLGQPIVIDNRPGASGMIGADMVAKAAPDGYTLLANASIHVINPSLYQNPPYDALKDFAPVSQIAEVPLVLVVNPGLGVKTVRELIAKAKGSPLNFASSGNGSAPHLAGEAFNIATGVAMQHIPYKGSGPAITDLIGGQVSLMFDSLPSSMPHIKSGRIVAIAVTTKKRSSALPNVPTVAESGVPGFDVSTWYGIWAPAATPSAIVRRVSSDVAAVVRMPEVRARLAELGAEPVGNTPEEFAAYNRSELGKWAKIVKDSGAKVD
jgi:tripartite-type tricarboxylate transporter receptor subunit TctC